MQVIELPIKHPELFESLGVAQPKVRTYPRAPSHAAPLPTCHIILTLDAHTGRCISCPGCSCNAKAVGILQGVLLYGPPGTGKTLLARAVAHHTDCTFIRVSGSELVQKYIGEGSRMVRELFVMARRAAPLAHDLIPPLPDTCQCCLPCNSCALEQMCLKSAGVVLILKSCYGLFYRASV